MAGGPVVSAPAVRNDPPVADDWGEVVRPIGPIGPVFPAPSTQSTLTAIPGAIAPVVLLAANPNRLGFSIRNTSMTDVLYVKASASGAAVSAVYHTVAICPGGYYEDPYRYVGIVTGVWSAATGEALVDEYLP